MTTSRVHRLRHSRGFGLIELMIGILLGSILLLGLAKVFSSSRTAYQASEGLSRVQENGRFATDFLQRDVRMAGHMGCVNDQSHFIAIQPEFFPHFLTTAQRGTSPPTYSAAPFPEKFDIAVEGFEATGSAPGSTLALPAGGGFTPALPAQLTGLPAGQRPVAGSDVIMLRFFGSDSARVTNINLATNTITAPGFAAQAQVGALYAIANCNNASAFQATAIAAGGVFTAGVSGDNKSGFSTGENFTKAELTIYRAESVAYYVATGAGGQPALFRMRFTTNPSQGAGAYVPEELVEGIENIQILYGRDTNAGLLPDGAIDVYQTAAAVNAAGILAGDVPGAWRRVGAVRIGILSRSVNRGAVDINTRLSPGGCVALDNCVSVAGVNVTPPNDSNVRESYLTTIALRNRLFGN